VRIYTGVVGMVTEYEVEEWWYEFLRVVTPVENEEEAKEVYGVSGK